MKADLIVLGLLTVALVTSGCGRKPGFPMAPAGSPPANFYPNPALEPAGSATPVPPGALPIIQVQPNNPAQITGRANPGEPVQRILPTGPSNNTTPAGTVTPTPGTPEG